MSYSFNNLTLNKLDSTGTLEIGTDTASAITFGKTGTTTTFPGPISSVEPISFNDIDAASAVLMKIGKANATTVEIGNSTTPTEIKGGLIIKDNIDTIGGAALTIGGSASALNITPNTNISGTLTVQAPLLDSQAATKAYVDSVSTGSSEGVYGNFAVNQGQGISTTYSVYAVKVNKVVSLSFPAITLLLGTNNVAIDSHTIPSNLLPDGEYRFPVFIGTAPTAAYVKLVKSNLQYYLKFTTIPLISWPQSGSVVIEPFNITYSSTNSTPAANGNWGTFIDTVAPILSSTVPVYGSKNIQNSVITITLNEPIAIGSGNIAITNSTTSAVSYIDVTTCTINVNGVTLETPSQNFVDNHEYNITFPTGVITDLAGNPIVQIIDNTTWTFTANDTIAPTATFSPTDGNVSVPASSNFEITFSENVSVVPTTPGNIVITATGVAIFETIPASDARVVIVGNMVTINPNGTLLEGVPYHITIAPNCFQDLHGNAYAGISNTTDWNFTALLELDLTDNTPFNQVFVGAGTGEGAPNSTNIGIAKQGVNVYLHTGFQTDKLYRSSDSGGLWNIIGTDLGANNGTRAFFEYGTTIIRVRTYRAANSTELVYYKSTNNGDTYTTITPSVPASGWDSYYSGSNNIDGSILLLNTLNSIVLSIDGGTTWSLKTFSPTIIGTNCMSLDGKYMYITYNTNSLVRYVDGNESVSSLNFFTGHTLVNFITCNRSTDTNIDGKYVVTYSETHILVSSDYGVSFTSTAYLATNSDDYKVNTHAPNIDISPSGRVMAFGRASKIYYSNNYGVTWNLYTNTFTKNVNGLLINGSKLIVNAFDIPNDTNITVFNN